MLVFVRVNPLPFVVISCLSVRAPLLVVIHKMVSHIHFCQSFNQPLQNYSYYLLLFSV